VNTLHLIHNATPDAKRHPSLKEMTAKVVRRYLQDMDGAVSDDLYACVLGEVEPALLSEVMEHCRGNQSKAAEILGMNRATLRKKLQHYLIEND